MPSGRHAHRSWNAYAERYEVVSRQSDGQDRGEALDLFTERPCLSQAGVACPCVLGRDGPPLASAGGGRYSHPTKLLVK